MKKIFLCSCIVATTFAHNAILEIEKEFENGLFIEGSFNVQKLNPKVKIQQFQFSNNLSKPVVLFSFNGYPDITDAQALYFFDKYYPQGSDLRYSFLVSAEYADKDKTESKLSAGRELFKMEYVAKTFDRKKLVDTDSIPDELALVAFRKDYPLGSFEAKRFSTTAAYSGKDVELAKNEKGKEIIAANPAAFGNWLDNSYLSGVETNIENINSNTATNTIERNDINIKDIKRIYNAYNIKFANHLDFIFGSNFNSSIGNFSLGAGVFYQFNKAFDAQGIRLKVGYAKYFTDAFNLRLNLIYNIPLRVNDKVTNQKGKFKSINTGLNAGYNLTKNLMLFAGLEYKIFDYQVKIKEAETKINLQDNSIGFVGGVKFKF